jgi:hypothetical protein
LISVVDHIEPAIEQLIERGSGPRIAPVVDLRLQATPRLLSLLRSTGLSRDRLDKVVPLLGRRVNAGVDPHSQ